MSKEDCGRLEDLATSLTVTPDANLDDKEFVALAVTDSEHTVALFSMLRGTLVNLGAGDFPRWDEHGKTVAFLAPGNIVRRYNGTMLDDVALPDTGEILDMQPYQDLLVYAAAAGNDVVAAAFNLQTRHAVKRIVVNKLHAFSADICYNRVLFNAFERKHHHVGSCIVNLASGKIYNVPEACALTPEGYLPRVSGMTPKVCTEGLPLPLMVSQSNEECFSFYRVPMKGDKIIGGMLGGGLYVLTLNTPSLGEQGMPAENDVSREQVSWLQDGRSVVFADSGYPHSTLCWYDVQNAELVAKIPFPEHVCRIAAQPGLERYLEEKDRIKLLEDEGE